MGCGSPNTIIGDPTSEKNGKNSPTSYLFFWKSFEF